MLTGRCPLRRAEDDHGPTAVMKSAAKIDPGALPGDPDEHEAAPCKLLKPRQDMRKLSALIKTYVSMGGKHVQFNVVGRETLLDAQKVPEKHRDLLVRVAGYSAYFVQLSPGVQNEVICRTEHELGQRADHEGNNDTLEYNKGGKIMNKRIEKLIPSVRPDNWAISAKLVSLATESFRETEGEPQVLRTAKAQANILNKIPIYIEDGELIVGSGSSKPAAMEVQLPMGWTKEGIETLKRDGFENPRRYGSRNTIL